MKLNREDLNKLAKEINITLNEEDINSLLDSMSNIFIKLDDLHSLKKISSIEKLEPLNMIFEDKFNSYLREDTNPEYLNRNEVLKNSKQVENNFFYVKNKR